MLVDIPDSNNEDAQPATVKNEDEDIIIDAGEYTGNGFGSENRDDEDVEMASNTSCE